MKISKYILTIIIGLYYGAYKIFDLQKYYNVANKFLKINNNFIFEIFHGILFGIFIYSLILIFKVIFRKIFVKIKNEKNKFVVDIVELIVYRYLLIMKFIAPFYLGLKVINFSSKISNYLTKGFFALYMIGLLYILMYFVNLIFIEIEKQHESSINKHIFTIINKIVNLFIVIVGGITILGNFGVQVGALITGAGIGGLALALASQKTVANVFGAISVVVNSPFKIGDYITVGGVSGTVIDIGMTYLKLRDTTGYEIFIPNEEIISSTILNMSNRSKRRADYVIALSNDNSNEKIQKGLEIIDNMMKNYQNNNKITDFKMHIDNFGSASLNIIGDYNTQILDLKEFNKLKQDINLEIKEEFEKEGIKIFIPLKSFLEK